MKQLTDENFDEFLNQSEKLVLIDFWALWCQPCLLLSPILEKLEKDFGEKIAFGKVNIEACPQIAERFEINQIPTVLLFYKGKVQNGFVGVKSEKTIREWLEREIEKIEKENKKEEEIEQVIKWYEEYAKKQGFRLNPNKKAVIRIIKALLNNEKKYGARYCPCRVITGDLEKDRPKICPCFWHKKEIETMGHCHCGLFWK